jgi:predicted AlkP superfamily phosphohydrolase/phosphomutase
LPTRPEKLIVIGLDGLSPEVLKRFTESGDCPRLRALMERGSFAPVFPVPPVDTATNWATLATGAWTGTHGVNSFAVHRPGEAFGGHADWFNGLFPDYLNETMHGLNQTPGVEWIWQAAHRAGRRPIVVNYPGGWPPTDDWLVTVDGTGPLSSPLVNIAPGHLFATHEARVAEATHALRTTSPSGWANPPDSARPPLEVAFIVTGEANLEPTAAGWIATAPNGEVPRVDPSRMYCCLVLASAPAEGHSELPYDTLVVCRGRDAQNPVARLKVGEWSDWITETLPTPRGDAPGRFRLQLRALSPGGREIALFRTPIVNPCGWASPADVPERLIKSWFADLQSGEQTTSDEVQGTAWTCRKLACGGDWDLLITQVHAPDGTLHQMLNRVHPGTPQYDPERAGEAWESLRAEMAHVDGFVGEIVDACGTEDTAVAVLSDHGCIPAARSVWLGRWLIEAGLSTYVTDEATAKMRLHWPETKAVLGDHPLAQNVWVNLKGREPEGIVEPADYENVRTEVINVLLSVRDPETGACPLAAVLRKEDAGFLGLWGDAVGDVVYFFAPGYTNDVRVHSAGLVDPALTPAEGVWPNTGPLQGVHHAYLPGAELGGFSVQGVFIVAGPGARVGLARRSPIWATDVTPTLCHLMGFAPPATAEGAVAVDLLA